METGLIEISRAKELLASCTDLVKIKQISDKAQAVKAYLKASGESLEAQNQAAEIHLLADRRIGEILIKEVGPGRPKKTSQHARFFLRDADLTYSDSSRLQAKASVPEPVYRKWVAEVTESGGELASSGLLKIARNLKARNMKQQPFDGKSYGIVSDLGSLVADGVTFGTVYADPPWCYSNKATRASVGGDSDSAYKATMTLDEICQEPVSELVADKAHLHLWTTNAFLFDAKRVIEAWGFEYKSCFVWVKPQMGIGNYWRVSHEFMLLGVRGGLTFLDNSLMSWVSADRTGHSVKPQIVRHMVMKASPGPYLEMYGREKPMEGWTVYGNEIRESLV